MLFHTKQYVWGMRLCRNKHISFTFLMDKINYTRVKIYYIDIASVIDLNNWCIDLTGDMDLTGDSIDIIPNSIDDCVVQPLIAFSLKSTL